jgi:hypothetical protein
MLLVIWSIVRLARGRHSLQYSPIPVNLIVAISMIRHNSSLVDECDAEFVSNVVNA